MPHQKILQIIKNKNIRNRINFETFWQDGNLLISNQSLWYWYSLPLSL